MGPEFVAVAVTILFTIATSVPLGGYLYRVFTGGRTWLDPVLGPIDRLVLRVTGIDSAAEQDWKRYSVSLLYLRFCHLAGGERHVGWCPKKVIKSS